LVNVLVGVNVGDQQSTSSSTQFDAIVASPVPPISPWLEINEQPVTCPHHVKVPDVIATLPIFHLTGLVDEHPLHPP